MKYLSALFALMIIVSCDNKSKSLQYSSVAIEPIYEDSLSIRAIELMDGSLAFAANKGVFGSVDLNQGIVRTNVQAYDSILPQFRAVAHTATDFFMLSIANPALLYKTGDQGNMELVYKEEDDRVFYDAMKFWNNKEGIAIGDSMDGCLSIIITRDGGSTWNKMPCSSLPKASNGEGAFAASNTNIDMIGGDTWIATTKGNVYYSPDKGKTWTVFSTPILNKTETEGIYSIAFFDSNLGFAIGGDYTKPENNRSNKAVTRDGGKSWQLVADGKDPGYMSCVQFVPHGGGNDLVAVGFNGISYSGDMGSNWKKLSDEPFYTLRFLNDSIAYAAGSGRIAKLTFK
ncbi:WD40/YVTN/BNR-like repeat-containing protein [Sediminicola sp. 1XM1-17]|uniref:WD40/YVTN/BNR-like repeat-containing protein n=1 Tax=Sediminicola sp. 1XM1-17 TaxID=3127702 RepID=UPI003076F5C0